MHGMALRAGQGSILPNRNVTAITEGSPEREEAAMLKIAGWRIDLTARLAENAFVRRPLSPRAIRLLRVLAEAEGAVLTRDALMNEIWPSVHVGDESLTQVVAEVRKVLGDRHLIKTVSKKGYYLSERAEIVPKLMLPVDPFDAPLSPDDVPLEAYLAINEAQAMAKRFGIAAADDIEERVLLAESMAKQSASVSVKAVVLHIMCALHAGDRARRLAAARQAAERLGRSVPDGDKTETLRALAMLAGATGDVGRAKKHFGEALGLNPGDFETHYLAAQVFFAAGDYRASVLLGENAAMLSPDDYRPAYNAARAAYAMGDRARSAAMARLSMVRLMEWLKAAPGEPRAVCALRAVRALLWSMDAGDGSVPETDEPDGEDSVFFYDVAALAHAGEIHASLDRLERLVETGWRYGEWLQHDPVHAILAREPRYSRLLNRLDAAAA